MFKKIKDIIPIIIVALVLVLIYLAIWNMFVYYQIFPTGENLSKSDWLLFIGSFLSFSGTMMLGFVAYRQTIYENNRIINQRKLEIAPVFIIIPSGTNKQIPGTAVGVSLSGTHKNPHDNFILTIRNDGKSPIRNIFILDKFLVHFLIPGDEKVIVGAFNGSIDLEKNKDKVICFDFDNCEKTESGYPNKFFLEYEDIDGNRWFQYFSIDPTEKYYEYERMESV